MASAGALTTQGRVIWALMLREIHTLYGDSRLGYLWTIIQTSFIVASLWAVREAFRMHVPHGLSIPEYLLTGYIVWRIIQTICSKCMTASEGNAALLKFPQVTSVDVVVARTLVILATETVTLVLLAALSNALGYRFVVDNWLLFLLAFGLAAAFAMSLGLILASFAALWPTLRRIMPMVWRVLFFGSGIFFSPTRLAPNYGYVFSWNPILQLIEMTRNSLSVSYPDPDVSIRYLALLFLFLMPLGLLFERYTRRLQHYG